MSNMYSKIRDIAIDNWDTRMTFSELADLIDVNSAWHAGQQVKRAWDYFSNRGDTYACSAISRVFWSKNQC